MTRKIKGKARCHLCIQSKHIYYSALVVLVIITLCTLLPYYAIPDYKGDEVWYVNAARNYLIHAGIEPSYIYTETDGYSTKIYYGVNVLLNIPFWNGSSFDQQEATARVMVGDPSDVFGILRMIYNWNNPVYFKILKESLNSTDAGTVIYISGLYSDLTNNAYFLVGGSSIPDISREYRNNFVKVVGDVRAPRDIYVTFSYIKLQDINGKMISVNKTMTFLAFKKGERMFKIVPGFRYADKWGIQYYYNFEHPFLGKAFMILSMYLFGDNPEAWRVPSMIAYITILLSVAFVVLKLTHSYFWSFIGALLVAIDPGLRMLGTTAMLDIFVAMFNALAMVALSKRKIEWASLLVGLSGAVKLNGWFLALAIIIILVLETQKIVPFKRHLISLLESGFKQALIAFGGFIVGILPIEFFFPFNQWWQGFVNGTIWMMHRSVSHPFQSPVWNWFFNKNPFTVYFYPRIIIQTNWFLWLLAAVFGVVGFFIVHDYTIQKEFDWINISLWSLWIMWLIAYAVGSRAQYSYYDVQITPFAIVVFTVSFAYLFNWDELKLIVFRSFLLESGSKQVYRKRSVYWRHTRYGSRTTLNRSSRSLRWSSLRDRGILSRYYRTRRIIRKR